MLCVFPMSLGEHQRVCRTGLWLLSQSTLAPAPSSSISAKSYLWALLIFYLKDGLWLLCPQLKWPEYCCNPPLVVSGGKWGFYNQPKDVLSHLKVDTADSKASSQWQSLVNIDIRYIYSVNIHFSFFNVQNTLSPSLREATKIFIICPKAQSSGPHKNFCVSFRCA